MVELVVFACLIAQPQHCESFHIPFGARDGDADLRVAIADQGAAKWAGEHPQWIVKTIELRHAQGVIRQWARS